MSDDRPTTRAGRHQRLRDKIRASLLVTRLEHHALGEVEMTATQVQAATSLLDRVVPKLKILGIEPTSPLDGLEDKPVDQLTINELAAAMILRGGTELVDAFMEFMRKRGAL